MKYCDWHGTPVPGIEEVRWRVQPAGLSPPWLSDEAEVEYLLALPIGNEKEPECGLHPALRFGQRLPLMGEPLTAHWGDPLLGWRVRRQVVTAATWGEAVSAALSRIGEEIGRLTEALERRADLIEEGRRHGLYQPVSSSLTAPAGVVYLDEIEGRARATRSAEGESK